jgi:hypothetical protein
MGTLNATACREQKGTASDIGRVRHRRDADQPVASGAANSRFPDGPFLPSDQFKDLAAPYHDGDLGIVAAERDHQVNVWQQLRRRFLLRFGAL